MWDILGKPKDITFTNPNENKVFVARKAVFLEKEFIFKKNSGSNVELQEPQTPIQVSMEMDKDSQEVVESEPIAQEP